MLESRFKTKLIGELKEMFSGCIVVHTDPNEIQGFPDLIVLYGERWAALEGKRSEDASHRPNQDYYIIQGGIEMKKMECNPPVIFFQ